MKNIPKICHLTWTKGSPMSLLQVLTVVSFHKQNPDWRIIIHLVSQTATTLGKNIYVPDYAGKDHFYMIEQLSYVEIHEVDLIQEGIEGKDKATMHISDILRIKYLYEQGGVYSDFDMIWLRSMSTFSDIFCFGNPNDFETTVCFYEFNKGHHNNSNIVSEKGGAYLLSILNAQKTILPPYQHQSFNTDLLGCLYPDFSTIYQQFPRNLLIGYLTFYPYSIYCLDLLYEFHIPKIAYKKGVMGVHWFNGHELSQKYAALNSFTKHCSMSTIIKWEGLCDGI